MLDLGLIVNVSVGVFVYKLTIAFISTTLEKILIKLVGKEKANKARLEARKKYRDQLRKVLEEVEREEDAR